MNLKMHIIPITETRVRKTLRGVVDRVEEERDPLGLQESDVDRPGHRADPFEALIAAMTPITPTTGTASQAVRNAAARRAFIAAFPTLTSAEVARSAGSTARNAAALAARWRKERRIIAVPWGGELRYPAFQFGDAGLPLPAVDAVLAVLPSTASPWQVALWFATPSPYLPGNSTPAQFVSDTQRLVAAAQSEQALPEF